jgi:hypothetical protein
LSGAALRDAQRSLAAAHEAHVTMAMGAGAAPEQQQQAARAAAGRLKKHVNDGGKKRKREQVAHERDGHRAQRRDSHVPAAPRPKPPPRHGSATPRVPKRDRRTYNNRTVERKERRVDQDQRRQPPPPPPQQVFPSPHGCGKGGGSSKGGEGHGGRGKGHSGRGKGGGSRGGKGGCSFGGGGSSSGRGGGSGTLVLLRACNRGHYMTLTCNGISHYMDRHVMGM